VSNRKSEMRYIVAALVSASMATAATAEGRKGDGSRNVLAENPALASDAAWGAYLDALRARNPLPKPTFSQIRRASPSPVYVTQAPPRVVRKRNRLREAVLYLAGAVPVFLIARSIIKDNDREPRPFMNDRPKPGCCT
jgi:hypothetical protein